MWEGIVRKGIVRAFFLRITMICPCLTLPLRSFVWKPSVCFQLRNEKKKQFGKVFHADIGTHFRLIII